MKKTTIFIMIITWKDKKLGNNNIQKNKKQKKKNLNKYSRNQNQND